MGIIDLVFSVQGNVSQKGYIQFFTIFSILGFITLLFEIFLGGILYLSLVDKILGNYYILFIPTFFLFLTIFCIMVLFFIKYISYSIKRAKDFSPTPIKYVIYYTLSIILFAYILILGKVFNIIQNFFILYIYAFLPYLLFKKK